jgi:hypothetical protein
VNSATNVLVTDPLPLETATVVSVLSSQGTAQTVDRLEGTFFRQTVTSLLCTLSSGSAATVTIVISPLKSGTISNLAIVQADESDLASIDDSATVVTAVAASSTKPPPDAPTTPPKPPPNAPTSPPAAIFTGEQRLYSGKGKRLKLVGFQLNFSESLEFVSASNGSHHQLTQAGRTNRSAPKRIRIRSVRVSPDGRFVTLTPGTYDAKKPLQLTITRLAGAQHQSVATITTAL